MKTPLTKATLKQHIAYSWWQYAILIIAATVCWNLIYTTTAYRPPAEKKVNLYLATGIGDQTLIDTYMEQVRVNEMPDMEDMSSVVLTADEYYGAMQISTYIMAGEGDIYLMPRDTFRSYASGGAFSPLEEETELVAAAEAAGIDLSSGWRTETDSGEKHLYGIPATALTGFEQLGISTKDAYLCVLVNNGNDENVIKFLTILMRDMQASAPALTLTNEAP